MYEKFQAVIEQHTLNFDVEDVVLWKFHLSSVFSTKSFCPKVENLMARKIIGSTTTSLAWKSLHYKKCCIIWRFFKNTIMCSIFRRFWKLP